MCLQGAERKKRTFVALPPSTHLHAHRHLLMDTYVHTAHMQYVEKTFSSPMAFNTCIRHAFADSMVEDTLVGAIIFSVRGGELRCMYLLSPISLCVTRDLLGLEFLTVCDSLSYWLHHLCIYTGHWCHLS